ncbi:PAB-dependent poly(A)-specific ribonuclease subunit 3 [Marasmius sp. AFHP31]|nr:PAB-dependent poly(A)-specific ribonuclease subunit 3 [Marasmius sp. AFHP31]KAK1236078.1 PAB-dependent poly(A)-specific ribonuclease subunit 3 [Marasmius sp. AFHP31]
MAYFARPSSASAAVKIVKPNTPDESTPAQLPSRKDSVPRQTQCRNILIYGFCKFEDKGCVYYHPSAPDATQPTTQSESPAVASISAQAVNAPVFIPKSSSVNRVPSPSPSPPEYQAIQEQYGYDLGNGRLGEATTQMEPQYEDFSVHQDMSYYSASSQFFIREPLNYHLYTPIVPPSFVSSTSDSHFVPSSSELRQLLQMRSEDVRSAPQVGLGLPEEIQGYHTLTPLDTAATTSDRRKLFNWSSVVYRAIHKSDGIPYALLRVENFRLMHQAAFSPIEAWSKIRHPNIVSVHEAFTTRSFNDNSLVVAYTYHPRAQTLHDLHLKPKSTYQNNYSGHPQPPPLGAIPERTLWSYIIQIASAIKKVHEAGMAVRTIDATKVLLTGKNRVRISSCGVMDVLMYDTHQDLHYLQQEDLSQFGRLVFALTCNNPNAASTSNFQKSLDHMSRMYSPDVKTAALFLISKSNPHKVKTINRLYEIIGSRITTELDDALEATDRYEHELTGELENARIVRLLCKLNFINERPEFALDPRWSETGDRYIIKLFRDYVFHQVDEHGNPVTNLSHVLTCLNKLDAGSEEKLMLVARDEQSCLVVSYRDIRTCLESAFSELARPTGSAYTR